MNRLLIPIVALGLSLAACAPTGPAVDTAGVYKIRSSDTAEIQYRMLDSVNSLRAGVGAQALVLNGALTAAAETHAGDMSRQNRAWPFGSNGSSPYDRVSNAGFGGFLVSEVYAQTFETELETLAAWVEDGAWGDAILNPQATDMGFGWKQDSSGLIWWDIVLGDRNSFPPSI